MGREQQANPFGRKGGVTGLPGGPQSYRLRDFNGKVLEVATFRAEPYDQGEGETQLITDDNQFGTPETDARRRDFTVNALFYDPEKGEVIDYVGGMDDLKKRVLRTIGDPVVRFREDPVRMLRAVKFTARTGFTLGEPERKAIRAERRQLRKAAVPRLYEEILRMLWGGAAADSAAKRTSCSRWTATGI
jgi:poly(A) polymerase